MIRKKYNVRKVMKLMIYQNQLVLQNTDEIRKGKFKEIDIKESKNFHYYSDFLEVLV